MYQQEELSIKYKAPKSIVVVVVAECLGTNHWPRARWRAEMVPESRAGIVCIELYSPLCNHTWHLRAIIHCAGTTLTSSLFEGPRDLWSWWHHGHCCWNSCSIPSWLCGWFAHLCFCDPWTQWAHCYSLDNDPTSDAKYIQPLVTYGQPYWGPSVYIY